MTAPIKSGVTAGTTSDVIDPSVPAAGSVVLRGTSSASDQKDDLDAVRKSSSAIITPAHHKDVSADQVHLFRQRAINNGYPLVRVRTTSKAPLAADWQHGETPELLLSVRENALNTGLLLGGLRCVDCDVDDPQLALEIVREARRHLPPGALIRRRAGSPRLSMFYRTATGQPSKRAIEGTQGKIEILGLGQQAVVHGVHPSGAPLSWQNGRGPDSVPRDQISAVSEEQITTFLTASAPLLDARSAESDRYVAASSDRRTLEAGWKLPRVLASVPLDNDLAAGIDSPNWFSALPAQEKLAAVKACLNSLDNRSSDTREVWLRVLFAVADAERLGCPDARQRALEWSQRGASWTTEADFEMAWASYKPKPGGITVGSLLAMADGAGLDLSQWRDLALARLCGVPGAALGQASVQPAPSGTAIDPYSFLTIDPDHMPPHRPWSVSTKLIDGEVTVLAAKGGWGKSAYSISIACSAASGRDFLDQKIWGGSKRILYVNSEDDTDELQRRFIAAARHHKLTKPDLARIMVRGVNTPGHETLTVGDESAARVNEAGFTALDAIITKADPDIVILDPLGTFCPAGLNHNGVMSQVLLRLKRVAKKHSCAILVVHHTRKDDDLTNTDAIGGASAIVNQARVAIMIARMTASEAKNFKGILPSELWRYFRIMDAKTNLAPPSPDAQWYQLVSHDLPNAAPPTYRQGDGVQVVDKVDPTQLNASPVTTVTDDVAKLAILKAAHSADPPFSPSSRGGSDRYIVRRVLDPVRQATGMYWGDRDLTKHVESLVQEMMAAGWLSVEEVKVGRNTRQGLVVDPTRTPWAHKFTGTGHGLTQPFTHLPHQLHQMPIETIDANEAGGIDARRTEGASNVPKGYGDLTGRAFDAAPSALAIATFAPAELPPVPPVEVGIMPELPAKPEVPSPAAQTPATPVGTNATARAHPFDDYPDLPHFLDRRKRKPVAADAAAAAGPLATARSPNEF
jgi:hypothetical protein